MPNSVAVDIARLWAPDNLRKVAAGTVVCAAIAAVAFATTSLNTGQNGVSKAMWAAMPLPKKVCGRPLVRSISWSGTTMSSGAISSLRLPTALIERMKRVPSDARAQTFAR